MATIKTTKQFHAEHLFELLGGDLADLSVTPRQVGTEMVTEFDEDGNEIQVERPVYEGIPLDSTEEKEIVVTVKGDGVTPVSQTELDALAADYVYDPDYGKEPEEISLEDEIAARLQALDDATKTATAWNGLSAAQRQETTRLAIQAFVKVVRFVAKRLL